MRFNLGWWWLLRWWNEKQLFSETNGTHSIRNYKNRGENLNMFLSISEKNINSKLTYISWTLSLNFYIFNYWNFRNKINLLFFYLCCINASNCTVISISFTLLTFFLHDSNISLEKHCNAESNNVWMIILALSCAGQWIF